MLDEPEEVADSPDAPDLPPGEGAIRFEDVSFSYLPGRPVLEHLDKLMVRVVASELNGTRVDPAPADILGVVGDPIGHTCTLPDQTQVSF